jgi:hypothetical protein
MPAGLSVPSEGIVGTQKNSKVIITSAEVKNE